MYTDYNDLNISISDTLISSHPIANAAFFLEIKHWFPKQHWVREEKDFLFMTSMDQDCIESKTNHRAD